eukprot:TRINITY_DN4970_c0_g1_i1.p3 TRINITY_DN4970_c0_g1~~TRINITY_DN4970_c0_g1_i1.p3  ORF type:complete len:168 (+),score=38.88 TRINITY_DN4970_c0_g1_i1:77-505(+)
MAGRAAPAEMVFVPAVELALSPPRCGAPARSPDPPHSGDPAPLLEPLPASPERLAQVALLRAERARLTARIELIDAALRLATDCSPPRRPPAPAARPPRPKPPRDPERLWRVLSHAVHFAARCRAAGRRWRRHRRRLGYPSK